MNINEKFGFNADTPFEEKYGAVIDYLGEENVRVLIPVDNVESLKAAYSNDKHLNNIPLKKWDIASGYISYVDNYKRQQYKQTWNGYFLKNSPKNLAELLVSKGITSFSVAECVCILKECARRWVEEEMVKDESKEL